MTLAGLMLGQLDGRKARLVFQAHRVRISLQQGLQPQSLIGAGMLFAAAGLTATTTTIGTIAHPKNGEMQRSATLVGRGLGARGPGLLQEVLKRVGGQRPAPAGGVQHGPTAGGHQLGDRSDGGGCFGGFGRRGLLLF